VSGSSGSREADVLRNAFELMSAFDEVVSLGYRERVGISDVRAAMEMESHEERIQEIIARVRCLSCSRQAEEMLNSRTVSNRTRRQRQRKSSRDGQSSSRCREEKWLGADRVRMLGLGEHHSSRRARCWS
jgi:alpha-galactosidase